MDHVCLVLPLLPGQTRFAQEFLEELDHARVDDYRASQDRIGIDKEVWFLAPGPGGDTLIAYIEAPDFAAAVGAFAPSQDAFDQWFKRSLATATGLDLNDPPELTLPQVLSTFAR